MVAFKWIVHAQRVVHVMDLIPTERVLWKLVNHQKISNALAWWQGVKASSDEVRLATITFQDFRDIFEVLFVPDTTKEFLRYQFKELYQRGMGVQAYAKHFNNLALFSLDNVVIVALRVTHFRRAIQVIFTSYGDPLDLCHILSNAIWHWVRRMTRLLLRSLPLLEDDFQGEDYLEDPKKMKGQLSISIPIGGRSEGRLWWFWRQRTIEM